MNKCVYNPTTRNINTGEVIADPLFESLKQYFHGDHILAKTYYGVATDPKFLNEASAAFPLDYYSYTESPTITFDCFSSICKDFNQEKRRHIIQENINKQLTELGYQRFNEACKLITMFNADEFNSSENSNLMAIIKDQDVEGSTVSIEIVERNDANMAKLVKAIQKRQVLDRMRYYLNKAGFDTKTIEGENLSKYLSSAEALSDGLIQIIELGDEETHMERNLAQAMGHLILDLYGPNHPLVERIYKSINKEVTILDEDGQEQKIALAQLIKQSEDYGENKRFGSFSDDRKVAAYLIGKKLEEGVDADWKIARFGKAKVWKPAIAVLQGLSNLIKKLINHFRKDTKLHINRLDYKMALRDAEKDAWDIARGFTSPEFKPVDNFSSSDTFVFNEDWYQKKPAGIATYTAKTIYDTMTRFAERIKHYNNSMFKKMSQIISNVETTLGQQDYSAMEDAALEQIALTSIVEELNGLAHMYDNFIDVLNTDMNNTVDFANNMGKYANDILSAMEYARALSEAITAVKTRIDNSVSEMSLVGYTDINIQVGRDNEVVNLKELVNNLEKSVKDTFINRIYANQEAFVIKFTEQVVGAKQIKRAERMMIFGKEARGRGYVDAETLQISDIVRELSSDITFFQQHFKSMADNPDLMGQVFDRAVKAAKSVANRMFLEDRNSLLIYASKAKENNINFEDFFELDEENRPTGCLIGFVEIPDADDPGILHEVGVSYGVWEDSFAEFKEQKEKEFENVYGADELAKMSSIKRGYLWSKWFSPEYKAWHKANSLRTYKVINGRKVFQNVPNPDVYRSHAYDNLSTTQKDFLKKYLAWKSTQDSKLPNGSTNLFRAPQMYASYLNEVKNRGLMGQNLPKRILGTLLRQIADACTITINETDYGSDNTVNKMSPLYTKSEVHNSKVDRIPLFFINKIKKENRMRLSTDLIGTSLAYSSMANQYACLESLKSSIRLAIGQMKKRRTGAKTDDDNDSDREDKGSTRAYRRIISYVDKEMFGMQYKIRRSEVSDALIKLAQNLMTLASRAYLGGNIQGGIANTNMGFFEILKEGLVGQYFDMGAWGEAMKEYFGNTVELLADSFRQIKLNKINLFAERMDVFGDAFRIHTNYNFRNPNIEALKTLDIWWHNAFMPYSMGDHFMQLIPFIAMAKDTPLYYKGNNGETIRTNLYDAFYVDISEEKSIVEENGIYTGSLKGTGLLSMDKNIVYFKEGNIETDAEYTYEENPITHKKQRVLTNNKIKLINELISRIETFTANPGFIVIDTTGLEQIISEYNIEIENDVNSIKNTKAVKILNRAKKEERDRLRDISWQQEDEFHFKNKARNIGNNLHGIYNQQDKVDLQRNILGNMALAMRGYILGMVERRLSTDYYNITLGQDKEGTVVTNMKLMARFFGQLLAEGYPKMSLGQFLMCRNAIFFSNKTKSLAKALHISESQYYNLKRAHGDRLMMLFTTILVGGLLKVFGWNGALGKGKNDDSDDYYPNNESDYIWAIMYYFASRLYVEQAAYNNLIVFLTKEAPSALTLVSSSASVLADWYEMIALLITGETYDKGEHKDEKKWKVKLMKQGLFHLNPLYPIKRWQYVMKDPRKAAQSWEINRGSRGR